MLYAAVWQAVYGIVEVVGVPRRTTRRARAGPGASDPPARRRGRPARRASGRGRRDLPAEPLAALAHPPHTGAVRGGARADRGRVVSDADAKDVVQRGYDAIAERCNAWADSFETPEREWVDGCSPGSRPARTCSTSAVAAAGTLRRPSRQRTATRGVDISPRQLEPPEGACRGDLRAGDASELHFAPASFDAVVSLFMFGHIPRAEQEPLLRKIATWLRPGWAAARDAWNGHAVTAASRTTGSARRCSSRPSTSDERQMLERAGFEVDEARVVPFDEPGTGSCGSCGCSLVRRAEQRRALAAERADDGAEEGEQEERDHDERLHVHWTCGRVPVFPTIGGVKVGVVGLGTMGAGIAQISVTAGHDTIGREVELTLAERGRATIERYLGRAVEKERMTADERRRGARAADVDDAARRVRRVRPRDRGDRRGASRRSVRSSPSSTASRALTRCWPRTRRRCPSPRSPIRPRSEPNASSACTSSTRAGAAAGRDRTSGAFVRRRGAAGVRVGRGGGKRPVMCSDTPGFIVNRILIPLLNDCVRVLDEAGVTPADLDSAMTNGAGWPHCVCHRPNKIDHHYRGTQG